MYKKEELGLIEFIKICWRTREENDDACFCTSYSENIHFFRFRNTQICNTVWCDI
jgi:hypothetical protein